MGSDKWKYQHTKVMSFCATSSIPVSSTKSMASLISCLIAALLFFLQYRNQVGSSLKQDKATYCNNSFRHIERNWCIPEWILHDHPPNYK